MISRQIESSKERFEYGMLVDSIIRARELFNNEPLDIIFKAQLIGRMWLPQYNSNTYNDLINTGNLNLVSDALIADKVRTHYTNLPYSWNDTFDKRNEELRRIMVDLIPLKFHVAILVSDSKPETEDTDAVLGSFEAKEIFEKLIDYPKIDFYVKNVTRGHLFHIDLMETIKMETTELIEDLQSFNKQ